MKRFGRALTLSVAFVCMPHAASAQLGEVHVGALASYGLSDSFGAGVGIVVGVAAGRFTYVGLRWARQAGSTRTVGTPSSPLEVTSRVQLFALDLGLLLPVGAFEIVPGVSFGTGRFTQRANRPGAESQPAAVSEHDAAFFLAPGLSVEARLAGFLLIPELQYFLGSAPDLTLPVSHRGPAASLRLVVPLEVGRIRH